MRIRMPPGPGRHRARFRGFETIILVSVLTVSAADGQDDPIKLAADRFASLESYSVTLRSFGQRSGEEIRYAFQKPGFVRMDFIRPHKGAALVYNPHTGVVRLRPFGLLRPLVLSLRPNDSIVKSSKGHTVDKSNIGTLLETVMKLQSMGVTKMLGEERLGDRICTVVEVVGRNGAVVDGNIQRYVLWLDQEVFLPVRAEAYDLSGKMEEGILMEDLEVNVHFSDDLFRL